MYFDGLYPFLTYSTFLGFFNGIFVTKKEDVFINMVGYTSIGIMTDICYPITYPMIGYYVLHKKNKE
jgi:hypothetical protein